MTKSRKDQSDKDKSKTREWAVPPNVRVTRGPLIPAPSPFAHLSLAQYVLGALVIAAVYRPFEPEDDPSLRVWMWASFGALTFAFLAIMTLRIYIQDWLSTLSGPEKLLVIMMLLASLVLPGPPRFHQIVPEGFATLMPAMLFFSASAIMARRMVFVAILGFWAGISWRGGIELEWILGFGAALLWTLSAMHFAFTGAPFGLRGWWPFFRVWQTVIFYFVPTAIAATLFFYIWPTPPAVVRNPSRPRVDAQMVMQRMMDFDQAQWRDLIIRATISVVVILSLLIVLYYLRKYLGRKARPEALPTILGANVGEIEYATTGPRESKPTMEGNRGRVLKLWKRWERAVQPDPAGRETGETAAEYTNRISSDAETTGSTERPAIARMLESAHYASDEPSDSEVRAMEKLVEEDIRSQK